MMILKRSRSGVVTTLAVLSAGMVQVPPKVVAKVAKAKKVRPEGHVSVPKDASDGEELAFKLHNALLETDVAERSKSVFACGKLARDIGLGDPDVSLAYEAAKLDQKKATFQENVESDLFSRWGVMFIGGFTAKRVVKSTATFKPFQLIVRIPGEDERATTYATSFEAHRAGVRWWILKSERGQHANMRVFYQETEPTGDPENPRTVKLFPSGHEAVTEITYVDAAASAAMQTEREKHGPAMRTGSKPRSLGFGQKVHETRVTFSRG